MCGVNSDMTYAPSELVLPKQIHPFMVQSVAAIQLNFYFQVGVATSLGASFQGKLEHATE